MQSVLGVLKGTYDARLHLDLKDDGFGNLRQMMNQGLLKREDIRIIWTSDPLPSPPVVIRKDVPPDMRADMLKLFTGCKDVDMKLAESVAQGKTTGIMARLPQGLQPDVPGGRGRARGAQAQGEVSAARARRAVAAAARSKTQYAAYRRQKRLYAVALLRARSPPASSPPGITAKFDVVTLVGGPAAHHRVPA